MIPGVTLSPAVDRTARVARLTLGGAPPHGRLGARGGKGDNAPPAANRLGALVITTGFASGHAGRWLVEAVDGRGSTAGGGAR